MDIRKGEVMEVKILSRTNAKRFSYIVDKPCIIISICDVESEPNHFSGNKNIRNILRVFFDDCEMTTNSETAISEDNAKVIVSFINLWKDDIELVVIHCEAGVSRSAGVGAAILKALNNDDMPVFNNGKFCPNMKCYREVLNAFMFRIDEAEINQKLNDNIKQWKLLNELD